MKHANRFWRPSVLDCVGPWSQRYPPPDETARAPDMKTCRYLLNDDVFVVRYVDGRRVLLPRDQLDLPSGVQVLGCEVDEFQRGASVTLDDGTTTSFSGDFVLYRMDPLFRRRVDKGARVRRRKAPAKRAFGQRVREAREARGWTLAELGTRVGMAAANVHRIETDKHTPSMKTVLLMAGALGCTVAWLLADSSTPTIGRTRGK